MRSYRIGKKIFYYNNTNDLLYQVVKDFYFSDSKLFEPVIPSSIEERRNAIQIDLKISSQKHKFFFKTTENSATEWRKVIEDLKTKYKCDEKIVLEVAKEIKEEEQELLFYFKEKLRKLKPKSKIARILKYSPVDEFGFSEKTFFDIFDAKDDKLKPNNGVGWKRDAEAIFKVETWLGENGLTIAYKFNGFNFDYEHKNRYIRDDIKKIISKQKCAHCNTRTKIEVDHKNGRYDDKEVLNSITQNLSDFQPLCNKCNKIKRNSCKRCKENCIRYDASFLGYGISLTSGNLEYNDAIGCVGCYWFDLLDFKSRLILNQN